MLVTLSCPCPSRASARRLARALLGQRLIACANLLPAESHYWWKGRIERAQETVLVAKTQRRHIQAIAKLLRARHPYELPAIEFLPALGESGFERWVHAETAQRRRSAFKASRARRK